MPDIHPKWDVESHYSVSLIAANSAPPQHRVSIALPTLRVGELYQYNELLNSVGEQGLVTLIHDASFSLRQTVNVIQPLCSGRYGYISKASKTTSNRTIPEPNYSHATARLISIREKYSKLGRARVTDGQLTIMIIYVDVRVDLQRDATRHPRATKRALRPCACLLRPITVPWTRQKLHSKTDPTLSV
jgi:hypothetical protein